MYKLLPTLVCRKVEIDPCVASRDSKLPRWAGLARPPRKAERVSVLADGSQAFATPPWGGSLALANRCPLNFAACSRFPIFEVKHEPIAIPLCA